MEGLYLQSALILMVNYARTPTHFQPLIQTGACLGLVLFAVKQAFSVFLCHRVYCVL